MAQLGPARQAMEEDPVDRELFFFFFVSTTMVIGNGKNTPFWEARWLQGMAPKDLAPNLF